MPFTKADPDPPNVFDAVKDFYDSLSWWLQAIIAIGAVATVLVGFFRWARPFQRMSNVRSDLRAVRDTLVGRPAMRDSITNAIIPGTALPGIGERMAAQEAATKEAATALSTLAADSHRITNVEQRLTRIEEVLAIDTRLSKLESVQLLKTIESVAQAEPPEEPPSKRQD